MSMLLKSSLDHIILRNFPVTDPDRVDPSNANVFQQGQWWTMDTTAGNERQIIPGCSGATVYLLFPIWSERGEPSTQALDNLTVIYSGNYVADSDQFVSGQAYAVGEPLVITAAGLLSRRIGGVATYQIQAYVELPPANNGNLLRFVVRP